MPILGQLVVEAVVGLRRNRLPVNSFDVTAWIMRKVPQMNPEDAGRLLDQALVLGIETLLSADRRSRRRPQPSAGLFH